MPSYTEQDLEDSLKALDALIATIETRMPLPLLDNNFEKGFINPNTPEIPTVFPPKTFARRFLKRARRLRFIYLTPGL
jgi:hypothetical protein